MEISQHSKYLCTFCGKDKMKRQATGIWFCNDKNCRIEVAGGAYTYTTTAAASIRYVDGRKYFSKQQQHSVFPLNVGESNFSCCKIGWSSIHWIYIVCVRIIMDRTMTANRLLDSLSHASIITSSLPGLP